MYVCICLHIHTYTHTYVYNAAAIIIDMHTHTHSFFLSVRLALFVCLLIYFDVYALMFFQTFFCKKNGVKPPCSLLNGSGAFADFF